MPVKPPKNCVDKLKVLADSVRLSVLEALLCGPSHVGTLAETLGISQSLLSHHLQVLRRERLVEAKRDGKAVLYSLSSKARPGAGKKVLHLGCCDLQFGDLIALEWGNDGLG